MYGPTYMLTSSVQWVDKWAESSSVQNSSLEVKNWVLSPSPGLPLTQLGTSVQWKPGTSQLLEDGLVPITRIHYSCCTIELQSATHQIPFDQLCKDEGRKGKQILSEVIQKDRSWPCHLENLTSFTTYNINPVGRYCWTDEKTEILEG